MTSAITQYQQCYTSSEAKLNAGSENFGFKFLGVIGKKWVAYFWKKNGKTTFLLSAMDPAVAWANCFKISPKNE